jgi:glutamate 5-kinase
LLSDVDGLFTAHPDDANAQLISEVRQGSDLANISMTSSGSSVGTGGMATKVEAARIAAAAGIPTVLTHAEHALPAVEGALVGTVFHAAPARTPSRMLWLAHASSPKGRLVLDDGAEEAVVVRRLSLLAAGVVDVIGDFAAGDVVDVVNPKGAIVARGLVAFDADEARKMKGLTSSVIGELLGREYERELIHRDDLVVIE